VRVRDSIFTFNVGEEFKFSEYRCCYCSEYTSKDYAELFAHVGEAHKSKVLTCHLCQNIFLNYGSYVSHVCFGPPSGVGQVARAKFSCKMCRKQDLGTFLDFQFHLRKMHNLCEICLQVIALSIFSFLCLCSSCSRVADARVRPWPSQDQVLHLTYFTLLDFFVDFFTNTTNKSRPGEGNCNSRPERHPWS
jgi:hypothetical protein